MGLPARKLFSQAPRDKDGQAVMESVTLRVVNGDETTDRPVKERSTADQVQPSQAQPGQAPSGHAPAAGLPVPPPLELTPQLQAELRERSQALETASPQDILRWATSRFGERFTMATAFGPEGMVLIHMLAEIAPTTRIFNLDTGYQFPETLELRERVLQRYGIAVEMHRAEQTVEQYEAAHGGPVYKSNPDKCCADRKLAVLQRSVIGMHAWASAIRRDQSPDRAQAPIVGWDKKFSLVKVSPLANWTKKDVWKLIVDHDVPYNPLHDRGYPSIGCWPCTRAVLLGEDERAGRWSGFQKTECGLHTLEDSSTNK